MCVRTAHANRFPSGAGYAPKDSVTTIHNLFEGCFRRLRSSHILAAPTCPLDRRFRSMQGKSHPEGLVRRAFFDPPPMTEIFRPLGGPAFGRLPYCARFSVAKPVTTGWATVRNQLSGSASKAVQGLGTGWVLRHPPAAGRVTFVGVAKYFPSGGSRHRSQARHLSRRQDAACPRQVTASDDTQGLPRRRPHSQRPWIHDYFTGQHPHHRQRFPTIATVPAPTFGTTVGVTGTGPVDQSVQRQAARSHAGVGDPLPQQDEDGR